MQDELGRNAAEVFEAFMQDFAGTETNKVAEHIDAVQELQREAGETINNLFRQRDAEAKRKEGLERGRKAQAKPKGITAATRATKRVTKTDVEDVPDEQISAEEV